MQRLVRSDLDVELLVDEITLYDGLRFGRALADWRGRGDELGKQVRELDPAGLGTREGVVGRRALRPASTCGE